MSQRNSELQRGDFRPTATWDNLRRRAGLLKRLRSFFDDRGFLEVETPLLSADIVVDRHLDPFSTVLGDDPRRPEAGRRLWLQTSPEFAMKRLLATGGDCIFQVTRAFRNGERGPLHNPEFTMVEWYRREPFESCMQFTSDLCHALLGLGPAARLSFAEAFERFAGVNPHTASPGELAAAAAARGISPPESLAADDRHGWLDVLLVSLVEPQLALVGPVIIYGYPAGQAALAQVYPGAPPVAARFELYVRGIELANGYHELLDPAVLRERNREANRQRQADGKAVLPEESRLLEAMESGLPDCCGVALGFDRLAMLAAGGSSLAEVMAFPIDRA